MRNGRMLVTFMFPSPFLDAFPGSGARRRLAAAFESDRSEERRVGKECVSTCRPRWPPYHYNKKYKKKPPVESQIMTSKQSYTPNNSHQLMITHIKRTLL